MGEVETLTIRRWWNAADPLARGILAQNRARQNVHDRELEITFTVRVGVWPAGIHFGIELNGVHAAGNGYPA